MSKLIEIERRIDGLKGTKVKVSKDYVFKLRVELAQALTKISDEMAFQLFDYYCELGRQGGDMNEQ